ncbi:MAG: HlyD family efflux transporter periplasmic adaptor subunit [Pseudomonadota bacterium]
MNLYRSQALAAAAQPTLAGVPTRPIRTQWLLAASITTILSLAIVLLARTSFSPTATVQGRLEPALGTVRVRAPAGGTVSAVYVTPGTRVTRGQPLLRLSAGLVLESGAAAAALGETSFRARLQLLDAALDQISERAERRRNRLRQQRQALDSKLSLGAARARVLRERLTMLAQQRRRWLDLGPQGPIAPVQLDALAQEALQLRDQQLVHAQQMEDLHEQRDELDTALAELPAELRAQRAEVARDRAAIELERVRWLAQQGRELQAPRDGTIEHVAVHVGQIARAGAPLLTISRPDTPLQVALLVPDAALAFAQRGQEINLRYHAFPHERYGSFCAVVERISRTPLSAQELEGQPHTPGRPHYALRGRLCTQEVHAHGRTMTLQPGMTLEADLKVGPRTGLEWLLAPIRRLQDRW